MALVQEYKVLNKQNNLIKAIFNQGQMVWPKSMPDLPDLDYFYVENISNNDETLVIGKYNSSSPDINIKYSTNKIVWYSFPTTSTTNITYPLTPGSKLYMKANATTWAIDVNKSTYIKGVSKVGGNIMSLVYGDEFTEETTFPEGSEWTFAGIFRYNNNLTDASSLNLSIMNLVKGSYAYMFSDCTSLTKPPELPATTLAAYSYDSMFERCSSLTKAPDLPAATLLKSSYALMFNECSSLTSAKILATDISADNCTGWILYDTASNGTLTVKSGMRSAWLQVQSQNSIPSGWTIVQQ